MCVEVSRLMQAGYLFNLRATVYLKDLSSELLELNRTIELNAKDPTKWYIYIIFVILAYLQFHVI